MVWFNNQADLQIKIDNAEEARWGQRDSKMSNTEKQQQELQKQSFCSTSEQT